MSLSGDVHVRGVRTQQPGTLQAEGDALSAAMHLQHNAKDSQVHNTYNAFTLRTVGIEQVQL